MNLKESMECYLEAKSQLSYWKELEKDLRVEILESTFPSAGEGTLNTFAGDYQIKGTFKNNISIDQPALAEMLDTLSDDEADCISYVAKLSLSKYKALEGDKRITLDSCLTVKPGLPTLTIKLVEEE